MYFLFPIKAKWFVLIYGAIELFSGIQSNAGDNVAHYAHLGGMLFGFVLIKIWNRKRTF
jgi:membrane associated rhomboid family serine protease